MAQGLNIERAKIRDSAILILTLNEVLHLIKK